MTKIQTCHADVRKPPQFLAPDHGVAPRQFRSVHGLQRADWQCQISSVYDPKISATIFKSLLTNGADYRSIGGTTTSGHDELAIVDLDGGAVSLRSDGSADGMQGKSPFRAGRCDPRNRD
ncbi:MAG TPA: hypothetical protein VGF59_31645, partial [Bryobacteraceae bacterium]